MGARRVTTGRWIALLATVVAFAAPAPAPARAGELTTITIPARGGEVDDMWLPGYPGPPRARVLLPDDYDPAKAYPLLVLLAGLNSKYTFWSDPDKGAIAKTAAGLGAIIVMPEDANGWYADWWNHGRRGSPAWESYILDEVIPQIRERYRIRPERRYHSLAGVSMGGLGAAYLGGRLPGYFGSVVVISGLVDIQLIPGTANIMSTLSTTASGATIDPTRSSARVTASTPTATTRCGWPRTCSRRGSSWRPAMARRAPPARRARTSPDWVNDTVATHGRLREFAYHFDAPPDRIVRFRRRGDTLHVTAAPSPVTVTTDGGCVIHVATPAEIPIPTRPCATLRIRAEPRVLRVGRWTPAGRGHAQTQVRALRERDATLYCSKTFLSTDLPPALAAKLGAEASPTGTPKAWARHDRECRAQVGKRGQCEGRFGRLGRIRNHSSRDGCYPIRSGPHSARVVLDEPL